MSASDDSGVIAWLQVIESIKVYKTMENLEKGWAGQILDAQEIKDYAELKESLKTRFTPQDKKAFEDKWHGIIEQVRVHLHDDPSSDIGVAIAHECVDMMVAFYGEKYAHLRRAIWKKGFKTNKISDRHALTPEMVSWLDTATNVYYAIKINKLLVSIKDQVTPAIQAAWEDLLNEMCGDSYVTRKNIINRAINHEQFTELSLAAQNWLKSL